MLRLMVMPRWKAKRRCRRAKLLRASSNVMWVSVESWWLNQATILEVVVSVPSTVWDAGNAALSMM